MTLTQCQRNYDNMLPSEATMPEVDFDSEDDLRLYLDDGNESNREQAHLNFDLRGCYE